MGTTQHSQVESSQAEKSNSEKLHLPTGEGWGEGSTFNSATAKQLQKPNNVTCHAEFISASSHHQAITTPEKQSDHGETSLVARFRNKFGMTSLRNVGWAFSPTTKTFKNGRKAAFTLAEGATHVANFADRRKVAFTLAEVLITLGIIGIVAVMTLPSLIENIQYKKTVSKVKKSYSVLSQAVQMLINEKGELGNWTDITGKTDEEMIPMLTEIGDTMGKYFNQSKKCGINSGCGADKFYAMDGKTSLNDWSLNTNKRYNIDTVEGVQYNITWIAREGVCFQVYVDVNGKNLPNNIGKDIFPFFVYCNGKVVPRGMEANPQEDIWENLQGWNSTAWVVYKENMDYLKCREKLSWSGQTSCK